jgi:hypothetical protein
MSASIASRLARCSRGLISVAVFRRMARSSEYDDWMMSELAPSAAPLKSCWPPCRYWLSNEASTEGRNARSALRTAAAAGRRLLRICR